VVNDEINVFLFIGISSPHTFLLITNSFVLFVFVENVIDKNQNARFTVGRYLLLFKPPCCRFVKDLDFNLVLKYALNLERVGLNLHSVFHMQLV
jgi:hypothetical protein